MGKRKRVRRIAGFIAGYFDDNLLSRAETGDGRSEKGRSWKTAVPLLKAAMLGIAADCRGLAEVEELTADMFKSVRKLVGIPRRVPDTTLRTFLCKMDPKKISELIYVAGYDAWRRKALQPSTDIPFGIMSLDGKYPSISDTGNYEYLQVHHDPVTKQATHGLLRTTTSTFVTAKGRPILGTVPIPAHTNEQGQFQKGFGDLVRIYGPLFTMAMYDAGGVSLKNADAVRKAGKHYFFQLADPRWWMYKTIEMLLSNSSPVIRKEEVSGKEQVIRELTIESVMEAKKNVSLWKHAKTILKVKSETFDDGKLTGVKVRYFVTSMERSRLSAEQWLELVVLRWGVETSHQILDVAFQEDNRPWIVEDAQGALVVQLLRRLVYTLVTLYKSVSLRSEENRTVPFRKLLEWIKDTLKWPNEEEFKGLRRRVFAVPKALA